MEPVVPVQRSRIVPTLVTVVPVMSLPAPYRAIVVMREVEGLSTREVATILQISEANVKTRLHRARVMMREELGNAVTPASAEL